MLAAVLLLFSIIPAAFDASNVSLVSLVQLSGLAVYTEVLMRLILLFVCCMFYVLQVLALDDC